MTTLLEKEATVTCINGALAAIVLLVSAAEGLAHEGRQHKGKPIEGKVKTVARDRLTVETPLAAVIVILDDETKFERGNESATKGDLKPGDHVSVFGTRLGTGELVAREIVIADTHDEQRPHTERGMPPTHPH